MKSYKLLALVALASIFMLNGAVAQNVTLNPDGSAPVGASDMSEFNGQLQDGDTIKVNNPYEATGTLVLNRHNNIFISGADSAITGCYGSSLIESGNAGMTTSKINLNLKNVVFQNGAAPYGGFAYLISDSFVVTGNNVTIKDSYAANQGGAFYFAKNATFSGDGAEMTFTGNTAGTEEDGGQIIPNDIYSVRDLLFTGAGKYTLNGGIETGQNGTLTIGSTEYTNAPTVIFGSGAVNSVKNLVINGADTKVSFAEGSTSQVNGTTTIENAGTATNGDSVDSNIQFAGTEDFVKDADIINSNVDFSGKETFSNVTVSNGSDVNFSGDNSASGTVIIKDTATKAHFDGAQQLSSVQVTNHAKAESSNSNTFSNTNITVDDFGEFDINKVFTSSDNTSLTVGNNGVVNLLWADESDVTGFDFSGNLVINDGGTVNLNNPSGILNVSGTLDGEDGGALNLAIVKAVLDANTSDAADSNLTSIAGNSITVNSLVTGNKYIDVLANDFTYHEETQSFLLIELEGGQAMKLQQFLDTVQLPFAWLGSLEEGNFSLDQDKDAYGSKFYIFKVDGDKVPEPSTWALMILGVAGLYFVRRKNSAK